MFSWRCGSPFFWHRAGGAGRRFSLVLLCGLAQRFELCDEVAAVVKQLCKLALLVDTEIPARTAGLQEPGDRFAVAFDRAE